MRLVPILVVIGAAFVALGCLTDRRAAAQAVVAEGKVRELAGCLLEYDRLAGGYPTTLPELRTKATAPTSACARVGDAVLGQSPSEYAGYTFRYAGGGKRFVLTAGPTSQVPYRCEFQLSEQYVLTRACSGRFSASEVVRRDLRAGAVR